MNPLQLLFISLFGAVAVWFGLRVFMTSSMVRSALSLLASMTSVGAMFFVMQAEFLAVLQVMMMATEMSIMAIFMMMYMMDPGGMGEMDMSHQKQPSIATAVVLGLLAGAAIASTPWPEISGPVPSAASQNHDLGIEVMKRSMMIFETAGVTILTAMIAAAAVALPVSSPDTP
ncbi:NADH-quinone oxidoreductase subunit J family protein [Haloferula sargassicola]|uniref:NADH-quinone oxidoreductase subunit J n=1 Tax=Haloferula sargassicola TaxID=490096 RepID=A0ABP9UJU8_9BACT